MKRTLLRTGILIMCFFSIFTWIGSENFHASATGSNNIQVTSIGQGKNRLTNHLDGYRIDYPSHMEVDTSLEGVRTVIRDKEWEIEIYYDNFYGTVHSSNIYINYANKFLNNRIDHTKEYQSQVNIGGRRTNLLKWSRKKLARVQDDKNFYVSGEIIKNNMEVYTVFIKSSRAFANYEEYMDIISSFRIIDRKGKANIESKFKPVARDLNPETQEFYEDYFLNSNQLKWGIFENSAPVSLDYLKSLENRLDYKFEFLVMYQNLETTVPLAELKNAYNDGRYVELTLQTMDTAQTYKSASYDILDGKYDDYFNEYARGLKEFGHPVLFRPNNEMNGEWCVYSSYHTSKDTNLYKEVWRYIYKIFEENGVDNVLWVWNPHDLSFPGFKWNHYLNYYPGDEYVDIVGLTGYNTGTYYRGEVWRDFDAIYPHLYDEYMALFDHPFMITEFGSNEVGGNKVRWVQEMFDYMDKYPFNNIKVAIWWNGIDWDSKQNPARVYRLDNREDVVQVFRSGLQKYKYNEDDIGSEE